MSNFDYNLTPDERDVLEREADTVGSNTPKGEVVPFQTAKPIPSQRAGIAAS